MNRGTLILLFNRVLIAGLVALLGACGGGEGVAPSVARIQAKSMRYGQLAVIYVIGKYLRSDMIVDTGTCTTPTFTSASSPDLAILNCKITTTGSLPVSIKAADGSALYSDTLTVLQPQVTLTTSQGSIVMELNPDVVPVTVNNFLQYVNAGFYQTTLFHRVMAGFMIQGGGYTTGLIPQAGIGAPIALESNKGLFNTRSTVAMARAGDPNFNSATSQFFINLVDNPSLDYQGAASPGYAPFGKVIQGMDVVDAIAAKPTGTIRGIANVPTADITITVAAQTQ
jgi:cyclophilin family peptidyl-prolyl cis-trans isomerase